MEQNWIRDYFSFTRKERIAILALLVLIIAVFILPGLLTVQDKQPGPKEIEEFKAMAKVLEESKKSPQPNDKQEDQLVYAEPGEPNPQLKKLFYFDPNTASFEDWQQLGVRDKTIRTIQKYLAKGGHFNKGEDIRKIYGLRTTECERLIPYIRITDKKDIAGSGSIDTLNRSINASLYKKQEVYKTVMMDLNEADSAALVSLPGIGSKLASRILHFRDKLGGFYEIEQLAETYGLPDSTFKKIRSFLNLGIKPLRQIDLNTADASTFKQHPYISWSVANALVQYRKQHGNFKSANDILQLSSITPELAKKLLPYLAAKTTHVSGEY